MKRSPSPPPPPATPVSETALTLTESRLRGSRRVPQRVSDFGVDRGLLPPLVIPRGGAHARSSTKIPTRRMREGRVVCLVLCTGECTRECAAKGLVAELTSRTPLDTRARARGTRGATCPPPPTSLPLSLPRPLTAPRVLQHPAVRLGLVPKWRFHTRYILSSLSSLSPPPPSRAILPLPRRYEQFPSACWLARASPGGVG